MIDSYSRFQLARLEAATSATAEASRETARATYHLLNEQRDQIKQAREEQDRLSYIKEFVHSVERALRELERLESESPGLVILECLNHLQQLDNLGISTESFPDFRDKDYFCDVVAHAKIIVSRCQSFLPPNAVESLARLNGIEYALPFLNRCLELSELSHQIKVESHGSEPTVGMARLILGFGLLGIVFIIGGFVSLANDRGSASWIFFLLGLASILSFCVFERKARIRKVDVTPIDVKRRAVDLGVIKEAADLAEPETRKIS